MRFPDLSKAQKVAPRNPERPAQRAIREMRENNEGFVNPRRVNFLEEAMATAKEDGGQINICHGEGYCTTPGGDTTDCKFCCRLEGGETRTAYQILKDMLHSRTQGRH